MDAKIFKPFWSYDVEKTEQWLASMAADGLLFVKMNPITRRFSFKKGTPKQMTYQIVFDKMKQFILPNTLSEDGWKAIWSERNWYVIANEKPQAEINTFPTREGIIRHNRLILYMFTGILIYLITSGLITTTMLSMMLFSGSPVNVVPSPYWVITPFIGLAGILIWVLTIYSTVKLNQTNRRLIGETSIRKRSDSFNAGDLIKIRKRFWFDAPDKLEHWLEQMEVQGYNLQKISKQGITFYFKKGHVRNVSYNVDYQHTSNKTYFDMHTEAGWKPIFTSASSLFKWTIWSREYKKDEEKPLIYSDPSNQLKHARRILINNILLSLPVFFLIYLMLSMPDYFSYDMSLFRWTILIIYLFGISVFTIRIVRTTRYYLRVRNVISPF